MARWLPGGDDEQILQPGDLCGIGCGGRRLPQPGGGLVADRGDQSRQHSRAGQQHLRLEQPRGGQVEQHAGAFAGQSGAGLQPADQILLHRRAGEVAVAVDVLDFPCVQPVGALAGGVLLEHAGVGDAQLRGQMRRDRPRHVARVGQERAKKSDGADLDGEPEAVALTAANVNQVAVGGVEVEVAVQLRLVGVIDVAAVAALLFGGEEPGRRPVQ